MSEKGIIEFTGTMDVRKESPLDPRSRQELFSDLTSAATWTLGDGLLYRPNGFTVLVYGDTEANNGYYYLPKDADYSVAENWVKDGNGFKVLDITDLSELDTMDLEQGVYFVRGAVYGHLSVLAKGNSGTLPSVGDIYEGSVVTDVFVSNALCKVTVITADGVWHTIEGDSPTKPPSLGASDLGGTVVGLVLSFDGSKYWKTIVSTANATYLPFKPSTAPDIYTGANAGLDSSTNTNHIVSAYSQYAGDYAAKYCADLVVDGYSDWQLPSLNGTGENLRIKKLDGFAAGTSMWLSDRDVSPLANGVYSEACLGIWDGNEVSDFVNDSFVFEDKDNTALVLPTKCVQVVASSDITWHVGPGGNKQILVLGNQIKHREISAGNFPAWSVMSGGAGGGDMEKAIYDTNDNGKVDVAENAERLGGTAANQFVQTTDSRLSDSRTASDVYPWAKAATKPTYTADEVGAQEPLVSGGNIKTVNGESLLGAGNIVVEGGTVSADSVDTAIQTYTAATSVSDGTKFPLFGKIYATFLQFRTFLADYFAAKNHNHSGTYQPVMGADDNYVTDVEKDHYDVAYTHSQTAHAPSNAQANVIEKVKWNGVEITPDANKTINITDEDIKEMLITYYSSNGIISPKRYLNGASEITFTGYKLMTGVTDFSITIGSTTYTKANITNVVLAANTEMTINSLTLTAGYTDGNCSLLFK